MAEELQYWVMGINDWPLDPTDDATVDAVPHNPKVYEGLGRSPEFAMGQRRD